MRSTVLVLLLAVCPLLAPSAQDEHQEEKSNAKKPQQADAPKPQSALAGNSEIEEKDTQPQETNCEEARPERVRKVEIVPQPFDWFAVASMVIAILSLIFVWQQVLVIRNSERAWMMGNPEFNNFTKPPEPNEYILYPSSFKNFGRTPARIMEAGLSLKTTKAFKNMPTKPIYVPQEIVSLDNLLVPEDSFALTALPMTISKEEYFAVKSGDLILYAHGFVKYRDIFRKKRETRFCHYYRVPLPNGPMIEGFSTCVEASSEYNKAT